MFLLNFHRRFFSKCEIYLVRKGIIKVLLKMEFALVKYQVHAMRNSITDISINHFKFWTFAMIKKTNF